MYRILPQYGEKHIMAVLKMAAHICKDEGIEVFCQMISNQMHLHRVLKTETHILSQPEIFKQIDIVL